MVDNAKVREEMYDIITPSFVLQFRSLLLFGGYISRKGENITRDDLWGSDDYLASLFHFWQTMQTQAVPYQPVRHSCRIANAWSQNMTIAQGSLCIITTFWKEEMFENWLQSPNVSWCQCFWFFWTNIHFSHLWLDIEKSEKCTTITQW